MLSADTEPTTSVERKQRNAHIVDICYSSQPEHSLTRLLYLDKPLSSERKTMNGMIITLILYGEMTRNLMKRKILLTDATRAQFVGT